MFRAPAKSDGKSDEHSVGSPFLKTGAFISYPGNGMDEFYSLINKYLHKQFCFIRSKTPLL